MHENNFLDYIEFEKRYSKHTLTSYRTDLTQFLNFLNDEYNIYDIIPDTDINDKFVVV